MDIPASGRVESARPFSNEFSASSGEPRVLIPARAAPEREPVSEAPHFRVLLATSSPDVELAVEPVVRAFTARVVRVNSASSLVMALRKRDSYDLVISDAHLSGGTGLGMLAIAHQSGHKLPFMIVQSIRRDLIRVIVGGGTRAVLATRVVNGDALVELAETLLGLLASPTSSRCSYPAPACRALG